MQLQLENQQAVVFGASRGIGHAIATGFIAEGCRVAAFDRDPVAAEVDDGSIALTNGDATSFEEVQRFADSIPEADHIVYSIGVGSGVGGFPFWNQQPSDWARVVDVNLFGAVNVAHAFAPRLAARRRGSMLFLVSVAGQIGSQTDPPYSAAKAALINFVQCAARDLAPFTVRVNALSPGMVRTDLNRSVWQANQPANQPADLPADYDEWAIEKIRRLSPLGQWQTPPEFAAMATFLASEHARNITGQTINIDGGQVMHA